MIGWLKRWWAGPETDDGFGQSWAEDLLYLKRFHSCRRRLVAWRNPIGEEAAHWDAHPIVGRFGDMLGVAEVDRRSWIVRDRLWHGWPDPPEFAFFAMEGDAVWAAADFHHWPQAWHRPPPQSV